MKFIGIIFIVIGVYMTIFSGIHFQKEDKISEGSVVKEHKTENKTFGWPKYAGGIIAIGGVILIASEMKKKT